MGVPMQLGGPLFLKPFRLLAIQRALHNTIPAEE